MLSNAGKRRISGFSWAPQGDNLCRPSRMRPPSPATTAAARQNVALNPAWPCPRGRRGVGRQVNPLIVIPSRMASTRLPGKPLADIHGEPMIVHVWRRAVEAAIGPVVVACAEAEIAAAIERAGGSAVLTDPNHPVGTDRVHEAVRRLDSDRRHDIIVNLQGDLPTIKPD